MQIRSSAQSLEKENIKVYRMIIPRFKYMIFMYSSFN